jgi:hypothetical protein
VDALTVAGVSSGSGRSHGGHCGEGCDGPAGELRALALLALDRLDRVLARRQNGASGGASAQGTAAEAMAAAGTAAEGPASEAAAPCPVCAALAVLRGERPELANRLAGQAAELAAALREALADGGPVAPGPAADPPRARRVQRVPVERSPSARARVVQRVPIDRSAAPRRGQRVAVDRNAATGGTPC